MNPTIQPYQFNIIKEQVAVLLNTYTSVNDATTVKTVQALCVEKINGLFPEEHPAVTILLDKVMDRRLTRARAEKYLDELKETVLSFKEPSTPQVTKVFRKVKKLKIPEWENMDLRNNTYVGWNDAGTQKKFILAYRENKLIGVHGTLSPTIVKGVCSICQTITNVSMFLATTKSGGDGTYTKKGNYICHDSDTCNQQLTQPEYLEAFMENVKAVK
ncbi:FusB/FusC family EF-G-binding protein [Enterococcus faecalis]|uniref:FusB/FusC family EF-G-binding protein n=1 Tax=Enterococcus faecalis TaxID=1351 RepID=UPI0001E19C82|nr:elongation factor G-binding protein [Enterococcus faecalis]EFM66023.1 Fibronectin-binding protein (FBP) [Enterococcus faecalis TX0411]EOL31418.1 fibronectin-binding protein [Enterococcus faecalis EnGen0354]